MKPIQEYTKQEKLAAISEYNPYRTERNAVLRYLLAVRRDDADKIAYFESFGDSVHQIILNVRTYERGLLRPNGSTNTVGFGVCFRLSNASNWTCIMRSLSGSPLTGRMP